MTIDREDAAASLHDIAAIERRTREAIVYARSSTNLMLWGVLCVFGYVLTYIDPPHARLGWIAIAILGFAGTFLSGHWRPRPGEGAAVGRPLMYAQLALVGYGVVLVVLLWPLSVRQMSAFWPTLIMLGVVLSGLWLGRFFILLGLAVTALTLAGYFWSGDWFSLWMAVVNGGGLLAAGLWLRRLG